MQIGKWTVTLREKGEGDYEAFMYLDPEVFDAEREIWHGIGISPQLAMSAVMRAWCKWQDETMKNLLEEL